MDIIFKEKYVNFNQISDVTLLNINDVLIEDDIFIDLGDDFCNDWAGYSYWLCKSLGGLDDKAISSFVYVITWFMTSNPIDINPNFKSSKYYKNEKIIESCLDIYNDLLKLNYDSEIVLCKNLIESIYSFYIEFHENFIKKTERLNCILTYKDMKLLDNIDGDNRTDKIIHLLHNYHH